MCFIYVLYMFYMCFICVLYVLLCVLCVFYVFYVFLCVFMCFMRFMRFYAFYVCQQPRLLLCLTSQSHQPQPARGAAARVSLLISLRCQTQQMSWLLTKKTQQMSWLLTQQMSSLQTQQLSCLQTQQTTTTTTTFYDHLGSLWDFFRQKHEFPQKGSFFAGKKPLEAAGCSHS